MDRWRCGISSLKCLHSLTPHFISGTAGFELRVAVTHVHGTPHTAITWCDGVKLDPTRVIQDNSEIKFPTTLGISYKLHDDLAVCILVFVMHSFLPFHTIAVSIDKPCDLSPRANYTGGETAACRRS
jgi:hypothetical protein